MRASHLPQIFIIIVLIHSLSCASTHAQVLHTESFAVILDTTKVYKGSIIPDFKFQNQKEDLIEFENNANISIRLKNNAFTLANKVELSKYGDETLLSGGFVYLEYRKIIEKKYVFEPFVQIHWKEPRGLDFKFAGGINCRYRIFSTNKLGMFFGTGPFYEYERWNYNGVKDEMLPTDIADVVQENIKLDTYLSFKWFSDYNFDIDISIYHQARFDELFSTPRLASSSSITYNFTDHIGLILGYQNIYDYNPPVPIDKLFNKLILTIEVSF